MMKARLIIDSEELSEILRGGVLPESGWTIEPDQGDAFREKVKNLAYAIEKAAIQDLIRVENAIAQQRLTMGLCVQMDGIEETVARMSRSLLAHLETIKRALS